MAKIFSHRMRSKFSLVVRIILVFFILPITTGAAPHGPGIQVQVKKGSGRYTISSSQLNWTFGGTIGHPLRDLHTSSGHDAIGPYHAIQFSWTDRVAYSASIHWYTSIPVILFSLNLPQGTHQPPVAFPDFTTIPPGLLHFSYHNDVFSAPQFSLEQTSTPWLFFDQQDKACILSPASDFMVAKMTGDGRTRISSGLNSEVDHLPAHFSHATIMVFDQGIRQAWNTWGTALRHDYHRIRPANDADPILKYYGYWTDNGADYYYNYDPALGYSGTLLALHKRYLNEGIRLGYMQLDSWWYEKSIFDPNGKPSADHKNPLLPSGPWNRYGGLMEFKADPFLFPKGLAAFQQKLQLPLITHNRWIDPHSPYRQKYRISGFAAVDPAFWKHIMDYLKHSGVVGYEQDWLNYIYEKSPKMIADLSTGNAFTDGMAHAALADGIDLQYCMAMPRFFLQGVKYNNLTTIRTSDDRFEPKKWMPFIFTSQLAYEMGIWPWCDVFKSHETGNMVLSILSAGAVGTGDAMGKEDLPNIRMACRADGVLVKPDLPLLPLDEDYIQLARHQQGPLLADTYTRHADITTYYVFAFSSSDRTGNIKFDPAVLGTQGKVVVWDPLNKKARLMESKATFQDILPGSLYAYYIVAPLQPSGLAFFGDAGKVAATGKQRIASLASTSHSLQVKVIFSKGEKEITLQGYYQQTFRADQGKLKLNRATHLFSLVLSAPSTGGEVTVNLVDQP
ncbi:MAG: hypothetical protein ACYCOO_02760 [Chitinophagaceae bacterium]